MEGCHLLNPNILATFADIKKYKFYHVFCSPVLFHRDGLNFTHCEMSDETAMRVEQLYEKWIVNADKAPCFILDTDFNQYSLSEYDKIRKFDEAYFVIADSSSKSSVFGWQLRNFLFAVGQYWKIRKCKIILFRDRRMNKEINPLHLIEVQLPEHKCSEWLSEEFKKEHGITGWQRSEKGIQVGYVDLSELMDSKQ